MLCAVSVLLIGGLILSQSSTPSARVAVSPGAPPVAQPFSPTQESSSTSPAQPVASIAVPTAGGPAAGATATDREKMALAVHPGYKRFVTTYADFSVNIPDTWQSLAEEAKGRQIVLGSQGSKTNLELRISAAGQNLDKVVNSWVQTMKGQVVVPATKTAVGHYEARQAVVDVSEPSRRIYLAAVSTPNNTFLLALGGTAGDPDASIFFEAALASFRVPARCGATVCPELLQRDAIVGTPVPIPVATPTSEDPSALLSAAQAQLGNLKGARFTFDRTDGSTTSKGRGVILMPDRASYTLGEGTERVIVRNQMWSRSNSTAAWTTEVYVGPLNNPVARLQILQCATSPRVMPPSTATGETLPVLSFILPSNAATCASAADVQSLGGEGTVALRPNSEGIARLYYNLTYTGQQLRGGVNAPFQITVEFTDWNSGNLPTIDTPR